MEPMFTEPHLGSGLTLGNEGEDALLVREWRAEQLRRLGVARHVADAFADFVDWHELAKLVARGCPPDVALDIVR